MSNLSTRKCAGCSEQFKKDEMIKITQEFLSKKLVLNPDNKTFGRSVYICKKSECIEKAFKKNRVFKSLRTKPDENLKELVDLLVF